MWKVYEQLVGPFRALDGRNARRRHGRAAAMGAAVGSPAPVDFGWGKASGWVPGSVVVLTCRLAGAPKA